MLLNATNLMPKNAENFECKKCNFKCSKKSNYEKHILTLKHKNAINAIHLEQKNAACPFCEKEFKHRSSMYRHKITCNIIKEQMAPKEKPINEEINIENMEIYDLVKYLMKENSELKSMMTDQQNVMFEQQNMMMKVIENGTNNTTNNTINNTNSHNKAFNLNFFLNETCKDAMNIMDFVESIQLQLSDLEKVGELGYVEGISNIIVKNLKELDITQRPVHCTDKKRETIYIKDENKWEKDDEKNKIRKMIKRVASKNQRLILKFKELHPDCIKYHSKYSDQYNKLIVESMGGSGNNDLEKEDKIIRNIAKNVVVDKGNELL